MTAAGGTHVLVTETERKRRLDAAFAILVAAAVAKQRCPENGTKDISSIIIGTLARAGYIRVLISDRNYRTVEIMKGPDAGASTAPAPDGAYAWKVIDKNGTRVNGKVQFPQSSRPITLAKITAFDKAE